MYGTPAITFFKSGGPEWFKSHHIFECYALSGYRASSMSHHTAPTPHYRQPSPHFVWQHYLHHLKENSCMVKLPYLF
jgi:hypothetical protein